MRLRSITAFVSATLLMLSSALASESSRPGGHMRSSHRVKLVIEFEPQLDQYDQPLYEGGELVVSYIPKNARVDKHGSLERRADVLIHSHPSTPRQYFGRLLSLRDDVQIITSDRIVTDAKGVFRATLRTRNQEADWDIRIKRVERHLVVQSPSPNHALQRTEAGGTSFLLASSFFASLCR